MSESPAQAQADWSDYRNVAHFGDGMTLADLVVMIRRCSVLLVSWVTLWGVGCGPPADYTELDIQVVVDDDGVLVTPREVERHCECSAGERPALGTCGDSSDGLECSCDPAPASCLERISVEKDGAEVSFTDLEDWYGYAYLQASDQGSGHTLVLDGCGGTAAIALDSEAWPTPSIEETSQIDDTLEVEWSTAPPASSVIASLSNGFVATLCHDHDDGSESFGLGYWGTHWVTVHALTKRTAETDLGTATVWAGGSDTLEIEIL
jgi:hypothetical protein